MDHRSEASAFLRTRRARLRPEQVGLIGGGRRRVQGLRREEVALLAGMSVEYYARMERGDLAGVSQEVLAALARALRLDEAETDHLLALALAASGPRPVRRAPRPSTGMTESLQRFVDAVTGAAVWVRDGRMDHVASNALGRALYAPLLEDPAARGNTARFVFLCPSSRLFFPAWEENADGIVATMRGEAGRDPLDRRLTDLVGELVTRSEDFRLRWSAHDVRHHRTGIKRIAHPAVGDLELTYDAMDLPSAPDLHLFAYTAVPGSPSAERLALLGSLAATRETGAGTALETGTGTRADRRS